MKAGPGFRPLDLHWVRDLRDRCVSMPIPLFFKQVGRLTPNAGGCLLDGRTWDEYPAVSEMVSCGALAFAAQERQGQLQSLDFAMPAFADGALVLN